MMTPEIRDDDHATRKERGIPSRRDLVAAIAGAGVATFLSRGPEKAHAAASCSEGLSNNIEVFNVKDFGAKGEGDDTDDDSDAIQAAINCCANHGGEVYFPRGIYALTKTITLDADGVILRGAGGLGAIGNLAALKWIGAKGGTILKIKHSFHGGIYHMAFAGNNLADTGIWLEASGGAQNNTWQEVRIEGCIGKSLRLGDQYDEYPHSSTIQQLNVFSMLIAAAGTFTTGPDDYRANTYGLYVNQQASEDINFYGLEVLGNRARQIHIQAGSVQVFGLLTDDGPTADYAVFTYQPLRVVGWISEDPMIIKFGPSGQGRGSYLTGCDFRSISPTPGDGAIWWQADGDGGGTLTLMNVRIKAHKDATVDPDVYVSGNGSNTTCYAIGVGWDTSGRPGHFVVSGANARLVALTENGDIVLHNHAQAPKIVGVGSREEKDFSISDGQISLHGSAAQIALGDETGTPDTLLQRESADVAAMGTGDSFKLDGTYDGGHLVMGSHHLWVDATGVLRIKNGAPSSDSDGAPVCCPPSNRFDVDRDGDVDQSDFSYFQRCISGPNVPADPACAG